MHLFRRLAVARLVVALHLLLVAVALPARAVTVRPEHPRIWLNRETLTRLRARVAAGSPRWRALKAACDANMRSDSPWSASILNYALAYQVSGNPAYADKAISLMQGFVSQGMAAITPDQGYNARTLLRDFACGYDWCFDRLSPAQRDAFRAQMEAWTDWVWPDTNPARFQAWSVNNPGDNYFHGFMTTWMVGLALFGDSPKAPGYVDLALKKFNTLVRPYLDKYGPGGYSLEGTNYGTFTQGRIYQYLLAHLTATGEDLLNAPGFDWPRQAVLAKLYATLPERTRRVPAGDQPRVSTAPLDDYDRTAPLVALNFLDPTTAGYARWWLDHIIPSPDAWVFTQWEEFLWYRDDIAAVDYTQALPTGYLATGAGWMTARSDWGADATYVMMTCGPTRESHQDLAQNGFMIYRKEWLAATARLTGGYGLLKETPYHNTITVGGQGQPIQNGLLPKDQVKTVHYADTARYAYMEGEAKDAYAYYLWPAPVQILNSFRRQMVYLKPNRVVVFDRVDAVDGSQVKKWHLNMLNEPTVVGSGWQTTAGGSTLFGKMLLPRGATIEKVPLFEGGDHGLSSWRVDIAAPTGYRLDTFLNVLETGPATQKTPTPAQSLQTGRESLIGAQIGQQSVLFDVAAVPSYPITYSLNTPPALEQYVLNQKPNEWYSVELQDAHGATVNRQRVQASDQGVLVFPVTATDAGSLLIRPDTGGTAGPAGGSGAGGSGGSPAGGADPSRTDPILAQLTLTVDPTVGVPGTLVRLRARLQAKGKPVVGAKVLFDLRAGGRTLATRTRVTTGAGEALLNHRPLVVGSYTVIATATPAGLPRVSASGAFTIRSRVARQLRTGSRARLARRAPRSAAVECKVLR